MSVYLLVLGRKVMDRSKMGEYWAASPQANRDVKMKVMAAYTPFKVLEGAGPLESVVIAEFPSMEEVTTGWYDSPAYQEVKRLRMAGMETEIIAVESGVVPPADRLAKFKPTSN